MHGRWACTGAGRAGAGRWGVARAGALHTDERAGHAAGARGARGRSSKRASGDIAMLACNTAEGPAATRPRLLRHVASVRGHARPRRGLGAGWAYWLGQLGQVGALCTWLSSDSVFGPGSTQYYS